MDEDLNAITYFAQTNARGKQTPFGIKRKDRARHMYVIGKTGVGKSTLLENMAIQDIRNGEGVAFIDPHGSTADRLLEYVPEHRINDVVYFAPFDMEFPIAFNVMEDVGYDKRHLVVSGLITAFKKIWVDAFSARMEYILSNTLLALLEYPGATMLDVNRMLVEKPFRKSVVEAITDPVVKKFWTEEFANYTDRYTQEATPAIQNKVGQFTSNPLIRNIIGQPKSSFDMRKMMDEKKILIINLSKGRVGEVNAALLGSMLVTKLYLAAMSRADLPQTTLSHLPSFYFYVDEFQNFANESFADILSEARKYKLNLIIAHQYIEQMEEEVRDAVFGNVGTIVTFRVGPFDAEVLETIFEPQFAATDLVNLGVAQVYLTLMIDGTGSPPFSATTMPPFDPPPRRFVPQVLTASRSAFARPRAGVEAVIEARHNPIPPAPPTPKPIEGHSEAPRPRPVATTATVASVRRDAPRMPYTAPHASQSVPRIVDVSPITPRPLPKESTPTAPERKPEVRAEVKQEIKTEQKIYTAPVVPTPAARTQPEPPPLTGTNSLREALAQVTKKQVDKPTSVGAPNGKHSADLKDTLAQVSARPPQQSVHIPQQKLREMLEVDPDTFGSQEISDEKV